MDLGSYKELWIFAYVVRVDVCSLIVYFWLWNLQSLVKCYCSVYQYCCGVEITSCLHSIELGDSFAFVILDIALCKCFVDWKSTCLPLWTSCVFCWTSYNPILFKKQRTDISSEFLLGHRRKDIICHRHMNLWISVDYGLLRYTSVQNFSPEDYFNELNLNIYAWISRDWYSEDRVRLLHKCCQDLISNYSGNYCIYYCKWPHVTN